MRFHHGARDPRIARLVGAEEAKHAEMAEVTDVESTADQYAPDDEGAPGYVRPSGRWRFQFLHGKLSLTLKHFVPATDLLHTVAQ